LQTFHDKYRDPSPIGGVRRDTDEDGVPEQVGDTVVVAGRVVAAPGTIPVPERGVGALQDETGGIHVLMPESQALSRGDSARVRGVLRHENGLAQIAALSSRRIGPAQGRVSPVPLSIPSAAGERYEGRLARVEGVLTARSANRGGRYFVLREKESSDAQLTVFVSNRHADRLPIGRFEEGDEVAVTGIIGQYDLSYQILPRDEKDLTRIGQAQTYLWWALLGAGGLGLAALAVIMFLRAAVRRRTRELRQSQEELREKETRLRSITENVSDGIYRSISEEGLVYANQAFVDLFGYSSLEELREIDPRELYANPSRREELIALEARQGQIDGEEVRYQRKDGTTFVGLLSTRRVEGEDGGKTYFDGAVTDITDQKEREKALRMAKGRYQTLIENFPDGGVYLFDGDLRYTLAGGERLNVVGGSEKVVGRTVYDLLPDDLAEEQAERYRRALEGERSQVEQEYQGRHYRIQVLPVRDESGRVISGMVVSQDITQQRRHEEELERQNDLFERAQEIASVGAWEYDVQAEEATWTKKAYQIAGLERDADISPEDTFEVYHPEDRSRVREAFGQAVEEGEPFDLEARIVVGNEDEGEKWIRARGQPQRALEDGEGEVTRVRGTIQDITTRKQRERRLREERDLLDRLLATSPAAIVLLDEDGEFIRANQRAEEVMGIGQDEVTKRAFDDPEWNIEAPDGSSIPREELPFAKVVQTGESVRGYEHAIRWPDGTRRILSVSGAPLEDAAGRVQGALFHLSDVTERREREQALRERQEKIEALYEATRRLLHAGSRKEVVSEIHRVLQSVFEYPFRHTALIEEETVIPEKTTVSGDLEMPTPQPMPVDESTIVGQALEAGELVTVADAGALENNIDYGDLRSAAGVPIGEHGAIVVGKNRRSGFKQMDLRLLEVLGGYANLVLERLQRERALREAKREAEEASRLKSSFLANMSHEIRTPLTSIIGFAEALGAEINSLKQPIGGSLEQQARLIERGGKRLLETLEGVLNLSRLEAGQMELAADPVDLAGQTELTVEELRPKAENKGVDLKVELGSPIARADEGGVQIVARNLISNAIKYTEEGGSVWVRAYRDGDSAVLEVEDTGIGMKPEVAASLFEPFRQESEGLGRKYEGSGVGLAVTKRAVEEMGGSVEVETEKGQGSRFVVRLPVCSSSPEERDSPARTNP
jgi:PAS domain S-box-containing protein